MNTNTDESSAPWHQPSTSALAKPSKATATKITTPENEPVNLDLLPRADLPAIWGEFEARFAALKEEATALTVTDAADKAGMAQARVIRLSLKTVRVSVENKRKELKEGYLRAGQTIDNAAKMLARDIAPLEERMQLMEEFAEREAARIEEETKAARIAELQPFLTGPMPPVDLGKMSVEDYANLLADTKDLKSVRDAREQREREEAEAERQRLAAEAEASRVEREAARVEQERIRAENELLKKDAILLQQREAESKRIRDQEAVLAERLRNEALQKERAAAEAKQRETEAAAARERAAAAEVARQEREAAEAKHLAEQRVRDEELKKEREAAAAIKAKADEEIRKANAARIAAEQEAARIEAAEKMRRAQETAAAAKAKAEAEAAARKAAAAPDKEKLLAFAAQVAAMTVPTVSSPAGQALAEQLTKKIAWLADWTITQADAL